VDKGLRQGYWVFKLTTAVRVSILGLVDKGLRQVYSANCIVGAEVSILGLVDKGLRQK